MVNWNDPETLRREGLIFSNVIHLMGGIYAWETVLQFVAFDWSIISGKRRFRWPMLLYFACRYLMVFALAGILTLADANQKLDCQALVTFTQLAGDSAIGSASTLLMLRTIAVWNRNLWVTLPLIAVCLGHWGILLHGLTTNVAHWTPQASACAILQSNTHVLDLMYFYTMGFDLLVLVLTIWGLLLSTGRSSLWKLLFTDGIIFFALAFISNAFPAVFIAINLNRVMNIMFTVPAACIASVAACRSFIRLSTYSIPDQYTYTTRGDRASTNIEVITNSKSVRSNQAANTIDSATGLPFHSKPTVGGTRGPRTLSTSGGVHIVMETFTQMVEDANPEDDPYSTPQPNTAWGDKTGHGSG